MTDDRDPDYEGPRLSYSGMSDLLKCGEMYRLKRVVKIPEEKVMWHFVAGSTFHSLTEAHDRRLFGDKSMTIDIDDAFEIEIVGRETETGIPRSEWGQYSEGYKEYRQKMPEWVRSYNGWFAASPYSIAVINDRPAIELPIDAEIGGGRTPGFIDRVWEQHNYDNKLVVIDLKTSKKKESSLLQPGVYAKGLYRQYGVEAWRGGWYMARWPSEHTDQSPLVGPWDLGPYIKVLDSMYASAYAILEQKAFLPNEAGGGCFLCDVKPYCRVKGDKDLIPLFDGSPRQ